MENMRPFVGNRMENVLKMRQFTHFLQKVYYTGIFLSSKGVDGKQKIKGKMMQIQELTQGPANASPGLSVLRPLPISRAMVN